jgi:serine/threonine protein kinase
LLNSNQFNCVRKIGKGGFGHVLLATKATSSSVSYAIKCLSKKKMIKDPQLKKSLVQEINTMASLDHPNIVKLYKTFEGNHFNIQRETGISWSCSTVILAIYTQYRAK